MKLRTSTIEMIRESYGNEFTFLSELEELIPTQFGHKKVHLLNSYICFSNLFWHDSEYLKHCQNFKRCIEETIETFKSITINKFKDICEFVVRVYEFNLSEAARHKVIRLTS